MGCIIQYRTKSTLTITGFQIFRPKALYVGKETGSAFVKHWMKYMVYIVVAVTHNVQGGSNMTGTDLYVNKPHCAAAVRP